MVLELPHTSQKPYARYTGYNAQLRRPSKTGFFYMQSIGMQQSKHDNVTQPRFWGPSTQV